MTTGRSPRTYDLGMVLLDRPFLRAGRRWACGRAHGDTLEVAIGTGLNLAHYPSGVRLSALELDPAMAARARLRADRLGQPLRLTIGDAMNLPWPDGSFDTVVCTYALCGIADERLALTEMVRVLRPGGDLLLADHVRARPRVLLRAQNVLNRLTPGEHWTRRPLAALPELGAEIVATRARSFGVLEVVHARTGPAA